MGAVIGEVSMPEQTRRVLVGVAWVVGTLFIFIIGSKALTYFPACGTIGIGAGQTPPTAVLNQRLIS